MPSSDSLLNDYLDDRLDPAARRRLEAAFEIDPGLARSLRALSEIRELVATLPRDTSVDVVPSVLARIGPLARPSTPSRMPAWRPGARVAIAASVAAAALAFVGVALHESRPRPNDPPLASNRPRPVEPSVPLAPDHAVAGSSPAPLSGPRLAADPEPRGLSIVRRFIDNPSLNRVFSVSGTSDLDRRIASVIAQTTRYNYLRLSIAQGIVIDPRHPDQATVYAVVLSDQDLDSLRDRLRGVTGDESIAEADVDPAIAVQLAEITVAQAFRPKPRADVLIPAGSLALRVGTPNSDSEYAIPELDPVVESDQPTPEQFRSAPVASELEPAAAPSAPGDRSSRSTAPLSPPEVPSPANSSPLRVVLVWVARSPRGG